MPLKRMAKYSAGTVGNVTLVVVVVDAVFGLSRIDLKYPLYKKNSTFTVIDTVIAMFGFCQLRLGDNLI